MNLVTIIYLLNVIEMCLHALNSNILVSFGALGFKDLRESALTFLANQPVFLQKLTETIYCAYLIYNWNFITSEKLNSFEILKK